VGRLPFNFKKSAQAAAASATPPPDAPLTITQLAARIDDALRRGLPDTVRFVGEVSGFRDRTHWYFDLKDASAVVNCVMFQSAAKKAGFVPANGQQILASGKVEFYAAGGKVSVIITRVEPVGAGALELAYRALCEELRALGWFSHDRKRPLPFFPRKIAVVTSRTGAALQDVLVTMQRRCPAIDVLVVDCRVQGPGSAAEIAKAIDHIGKSASSLGVDALLVTRGGGSMEDLWAFNERVVAQAIVDCPIPVVAAIGHETDTTIAELVADERGATPTQAAMRMTPDRAALLEQVGSLSSRLAGHTDRTLEMNAQRLRFCTQRPMFGSPRRVFDAPSVAVRNFAARLFSGVRGRLARGSSAIDRAAAVLERHRPAQARARLFARLAECAARLKAAQHLAHRRDRLEALGARLSRGMMVNVSQEGAALAAVARQLSAVGPMQVLERGYSVTMLKNGGLLRTPGQVRAGESIVTRLAAGEVDSVVGHSAAAPPVRGSAIERVQVPRKRRKRPEPPTLGLFDLDG
jgi:exodeoxyribonuclease VII large subunit